MPTLNSQLGDNIKAEMARKGFSQQELADATGISPRTLWTILETHECRTDVLRRIASTLDVSIHELIGAAPSVPPSAQANESGADSIHSATNSHPAQPVSSSDGSVTAEARNSSARPAKASDANSVQSRSKGTGRQASRKTSRSHSARR